MPAGSFPIPEVLLRREAADIAARYRVTEEEALAVLAEAFAAKPDLARRVRRRHAQEDVTRWRDFREVIRECREDLYYGLRRYYPASGEAEQLVTQFEGEADGDACPERAETLRRALLAVHRSTQERLACYAEFYERFFQLLGVPTTLLDLGCGMHPLSYPFEGQGASTELYVALDKDERAVRAVRAYAQLTAPGRLVAVRAALDDTEWLERLPSPGPFELGLMLKVVPVLSRLDRAAVKRLCSLPAERLLLTGNVESMTRRETIEARERAVLRGFIQQSGRRIVGEFRVGNECGYLAA